MHPLLESVEEPATCQKTVGEARIQFLSAHLVRVELANEQGRFCDEPTFMVPRREFEGYQVEMKEDGNRVEFFLPNAVLNLPASCDSLSEIIVRDKSDGSVLWQCRRDWPVSFTFPEPPGGCPKVWALADQPRAIVPPWGACPGPQDELEKMQPEHSCNNGWIIEEDAKDIYLFITGGNFETLRKEFLRLTGPIPMPPLWALGFWTSRYYPYSEQSALSTIDHFRSEGIPLDVFVIDTDWRVGASQGYEIDSELFPDMRRYLEHARNRHVRSVFNDHPEPRESRAPLDPELLRYRQESLTKLVDMGLDTWWFDRNWENIIPGPARGIEAAVWGQALYYDILSRHQPGKRTMILSMFPEHPAGHRFPVWWTGDIYSDWETLREGIGETLNLGTRLLPWVHQDLGGHRGFPSPEQYVRWLQWGVLSPIARIHCGPKDRFRYPWAYGDETCRIVREYIRLRYRLLPVFYSAARQAYEDGTPILRKLSWEWPDCKEADRDDQYLLGNDLLVAPISHSSNEPEQSETTLRPQDGFLMEIFPDRLNTEERIDARQVAEVRLNPQCHSANVMAWGKSFFVRWTGEFTPKDTGYYKFFFGGNGRKQLYFGDSPIPAIKGHFDNGRNSVTFKLEKGKTYPIRAEIEILDIVADCRLSMFPIKPFSRLARTGREVWIPLGLWHDLWTGESIQGPATVHVEAPVRTIPMYVRAGGIVPLAPDMDYTEQKPWNPITLEVFPTENDRSSECLLYEDDGESEGYKAGKYSKTPLILRKKDSQLELEVGPPQGNFRMVDFRDWVVRFHLSRGERCTRVFLDGIEVDSGMPSQCEVSRIGPLPKGESILIPLCGAGSPPPTGSGTVVECYVWKAETFSLKIELAD